MIVRCLDQTILSYQQGVLFSPDFGRLPQQLNWDFCPFARVTGDEFGQFCPAEKFLVAFNTTK